MDAKTLEYMGKRVDEARGLTARISDAIAMRARLEKNDPIRCQTYDSNRGCWSDLPAKSDLVRQFMIVQLTCHITELNEKLNAL